MKRILIFMAAGFLSASAFANNITVTAATLSGQNTGAQTEVITFTVAWENSWRTSTNEANYDGAWIFVKFRKMGTSDWRHCTIDNLAGFVPASGASITVPTDKKGAFIYRSADGIGNISFAANQLQWNYGADGIANNETVEIRVFAVETVYIPQGKYSLGSGGTETKAFFLAGSSPAPYQVNDNSAITAGAVAGNLSAAAGGGAALLAGTIPAAYPKGYNAFWIMKYETTQQQYADFLNHIDLAKATPNLSSPITGTHPNYTAPQPEKTIGNFSAAKAAALADWMGMRPMSELEFEKACRGANTPPVANEYVWGTTAVSQLTAVTNAGAANETVSTPANANAILGSFGGFGRAGLFARTSGSDRVISGATYYGVMNMGDNAYEIVFSATTAQSRLLSDAVHGDGYLNSAGVSDISVWNPYQAWGARGGGYNSGTAEGRTSDRGSSLFFQDTYNSDIVIAYFTARMVRTAP